MKYIVFMKSKDQINVPQDLKFKTEEKLHISLKFYIWNPIMCIMVLGGLILLGKTLSIRREKLHNYTKY